MVDPRIVPRAEHPISRRDIDPDALKVLYRLRQYDHTAYLVGGSVRDLLLNRRPKDFDIGTSAHPYQVKKLFRNCWIIGRRFRLAHVKFGTKVIEVATFRRQVAPGEEVVQDGVPAPDPSTPEGEHLIHRDNTFGTPEEDAFRRDFTINALFYDPAREELIDYHGGLADLKKRVLRMIGDPETRYREDPVRMLRAVRLAGKLGLSIDQDTRAPIRRLAELLEQVPPPRLFDEMLKLLLSGHASACLRQLRDEGLHKGVLPLLDVILDQPLGERFVTLALAQTDARVQEGKSISPAFLFAALLWHEVLAAWRLREKRGEQSILALESAMDEVLDLQCEKLAITRRLTATMREIWAMQPRFEHRSGQRALRLVEVPRFRMAYDFLALRAASGEVPAELEAWWRAFQVADMETRRAMLLPETGPKKRRRRRRKKKAPGAPTPAQA